MNLKYIKKGKLCRKIIDLDILNPFAARSWETSAFAKNVHLSLHEHIYTIHVQLQELSGEFFIIIFILSTHYLLYGYTEFLKSGFKTSSSCWLHNNHVMDTQGHG